jgi:hypothetical protein
MRAIPWAALAVTLAVMGQAAAFGEEPPAPKDPPAAPEKLAAAEDVPKAAEPDKIYLPAGFKAKKRGKFTLYCRKEEVMGTRFPVEKCYDEKGIRDYVLDQRENQKQVDQMRRICGSQDACGGGG